MDVKIETVEKHSDSRGDLIVFLKNDEFRKNNKEFGQIYFVTFKKKGEIRGNHYHHKIREWFGVINGKLKVYLMDVESGEKKSFVMDSKKDKYMRMEIGPKVAHTFVSLTDSAALLNYTNKLWSPDDVYEAKLK